MGMIPWWVKGVRGFVGGLSGHGEIRKGVRVLCYHGVVERNTDPLLERNFLTLSQFREHLQLLRRSQILSMDDFLMEIQRPTKRCGVRVLLTFDDGYANNLLAAEILHCFNLPWTLFVSTGALGKDRSLWTTELALLLLYGEATRVELEGTSWPLCSREERQQAFQAVRQWMKRLPAPQRRMMLERLRRQFPAEEAKRLLSRFSSLQMLTWEEICQFASSGVHIGSHGVDHEIHHANQPESVRRWELTASKEEIEHRLGRPCLAFSYPNGDFCPESGGELRESGYRLGFTTEPGSATRDVSPWYLPRISPRHSLQSLAEDLFWEMP